MTKQSNAEREAHRILALSDDWQRFYVKHYQQNAAASLVGSTHKRNDFRRQKLLAAQAAYENEVARLVHEDLERRGITHEFREGGNREMSEQTWQTMEAGRELDAAVARALGYEVYSGDGEQFMPDYGWLQNAFPIRVPDYSTDLNAAWELLPINRYIQISRHSDRGGAAIGIPNEIGAEIRNPASILESIGFAETPALAICRAWLAWKDGAT